jgi:glycosyltransferase involved in cell wall biosynthesis
VSAPRVSVIVPTFGRPQFLAEALATVAAQTMPDLECIVIDDGSTDPVSLPFVDDRFRVVRHEQNLGVAAARNTGLAAATGEHVAFLDDDDLWTECHLECALRLVHPGVIAVSAAGRVGSDRVDVVRVAEPFSHTVMDRNPPSMGSTLVIRDECLPFDPRFRSCEDLDWWVRMSRSSTVAVGARVGWLWRQHSEPRVGHGARARIEGSMLLLSDHAAFFDARPRALAYRWIRIAWLSRDLGDVAAARRAARQAVRSDPAPRTIARAARLLVGR